MRNLINFLLRNISWFVFIALELICFYFIFSNNSYQRSVFLNSSNAISGNLYALTGNVTSYFGLRIENEELLKSNAELQDKVTFLYSVLDDKLAKEDSIRSIIKEYTPYSDEYGVEYARVINNSVYKTQNFITINKGSKAGLAEGMGVISHQGAIGLVRSVSDNFAVVQPILNSDSKFSCKILRSNVQGTLIWEGEDPRYANLIDYPRYEAINIGDTIITSGFSEVFPEGIMVGTVDEYQNHLDGNFYKIKVKLSTDFSSIKNVIVIEKKGKSEKQELENKLHNVKR